MQTTTPDLDSALTSTEASIVAMFRGDPGPYSARWSEADDVTLFGAWGPIEQGHARLTETFRWVASRFGPEGDGTQDIRTVHATDDLAVTVAMERGTVQVDGGEPFEMTIRATHVYRREEGEWRLVHRHADFPPPDQRP
jgi:ketosteroid isomerase-like protein